MSDFLFMLCNPEKKALNGCAANTRRSHNKLRINRLDNGERKLAEMRILD